MQDADLKLNTMNIELTTKCPLRCPQCYCSLTGGKDIDLDTAVFWLREGGRAGVGEVMLSGGETMCYPHLYEVIDAARRYCGNPNIALSGYNLTQETYERLIAAGTKGIYVSLNGSTESVNRLSRDGYDLAISALALLQKNHFTNTTINWVMHSSNADDFQNVVNLAEQYEVASIVIIGLKPDSHNRLDTMPTKEQMYAVRDIIHSHKGNTKIYIETCYSPLLALTCDTKLFGNFNVGKNKGCCAGRTTFSVSVDGKLSPCRHLDYYETYASLADYWEQSDILRRLREMDNEPCAEPCSSCWLMPYCRPCAAIHSKLEHRLFRGNRYCPLGSSSC